ncbi:MAG: anti-sigma factor [Azospirillaceae bacterium]|nr:anti-sigma factor [Azospirillaceae bacterium]
MVTRPIADEELHAYVDGQLDSARRIQVDAWLAEDGAGQVRLEAYRAQDEALHQLFDSVLTEPLPPGLADLTEQLRARLDDRAAAPVPDRGPVRRTSPARGDVAAVAAAMWARLRRWDRSRVWSLWPQQGWVQALAAITLLIAGGVGGYGLRTGAAPVPAPAASVVTADGQQPQPGLKTFAEEAVQAHVFYTADTPQPVEIAADDRGELNRRLSERLGKSIFGPDLGSVGYRLVGGRSFPIATGAGAQYMYQNDQGKVLTLLVGKPKAGQETAFRFYQQDDRAMFYWVEGTLAYALVGPVAHDDLMKVAEAVYKVMKDPPLETKRPEDKAAPQPTVTAPPAPAPQPSVQPTSAQQSNGAPRGDAQGQPVGGAIQPIGQQGADMQPKAM